MEVNGNEDVVNATDSEESLSPVNNSRQPPASSPTNNSRQPPTASPTNNSRQLPPHSPVNNSQPSPSSPLNNVDQPLFSTDNSINDTLHKDSSFTSKSELSNIISNINNDNEVSLSNSTSSDFTNSCNEISELEITNATCESLDNFQAANSDNTLEISNCFSEAESSDVAHEKKDVSGISISSCSEITEDAVVSEMFALSSPIKMEASSSSANDVLSANETSAVTEDASDKSSSDLTSSDDSEEEEDSDEIIDIADVYPTAMKWQLRNNNPKLPETVTALTAPGGSKVYLVGTAHFSVESQEDVSVTMRATQPDVLVLELCQSRINILTLDENSILEEVKNMNFEKMRTIISQNGFKQGILYILFLNLSAHLTKELGMAPGGEFRRAYIEAKQIPQCSIQLGDRPIHVTLQRVLATLSVWKKLQIAWYLMTCRDPIGKEDVERCKQKDLLLEMLAEMTGDFPEMSKVFIQERDLYLAYSLQLAAKPIPSNVIPSGETPTVVVGVVGMGHVPGIVKYWNTVTESDIIPIVKIPEESKTSKVIYGALRYSMYGLVVYGCYRLVPSSVWQKPIDAIGRLIRH